MTATHAAVHRLLEAVRLEHAALAKAAAIHAREHAPAFNMVELLAPGETALSSVFRWMLDENASHGQGGIFRDLFFARVVDGGGVDWAGSRAWCEVPTADGHGRIDLLIESRDGRASIAVENKPWARWQLDQLARYLDDQRSRRVHARVHALIGGVTDAGLELARHWTEDRSTAGTALPDTVTASGFDIVAAWVEACAEVARPDRVRSLLFALARYCREAILMEPAMSDCDKTADLIMAGGPDALSAAYAIEAAVPVLARRLTEAVAARLGGRRETVGKHEVLRLEMNGVPLAFALFGVGRRCWAGVTEQQWVSSLRANLDWATPEARWPGWLYLPKAGEEGRILSDAAQAFDLDTVASITPAVARRLVIG